MYLPERRLSIFEYRSPLLSSSPPYTSLGSSVSDQHVFQTIRPSHLKCPLPLMLSTVFICLSRFLCYFNLGGLLLYVSYYFYASHPDISFSITCIAYSICLSIVLHTSTTLSILFFVCVQVYAPNVKTEIKDSGL